MSPKRPCLTRYHDTHPDHLATTGQLEAEGLKPGTTEPVALLEYVNGDRSGLCGLFERSMAVPIGPKREAS